MKSTMKYILLRGLLLLIGGWTYASAAVFEGHPDVIGCKLSGNAGSPGTLVFYVEGRDSAGVIYYRCANRQLSLKVSKNVVVQPDASGPNSCIGKSLKELGEQQSTFHYSSG
jgi:hypothetical protein